MLGLLVRTMPSVVIFPEVISAIANQDLQAETVRQVRSLEIEAIKTSYFPSGNVVLFPYLTYLLKIISTFWFTFVFYDGCI